MITQIRIFKIREGQMDNFLAAWWGGAYPLRLEHGFRIEGAWVVPQRYQFIWILSYEGVEDWAAKNAAYYASNKRLSLDPDPRQYIEQAEEYFVTPILSSKPNS